MNSNSSNGSDSTAYSAGSKSGTTVKPSTHAGCGAPDRAQQPGAWTSCTPYRVPPSGPRFMSASQPHVTNPPLSTVGPAQSRFSPAAPPFVPSVIDAQQKLNSYLDAVNSMLESQQAFLASIPPEKAAELLSNPTTWRRFPRHQVLTGLETAYKVLSCGSMPFGTEGVEPYELGKLNASIDTVLQSLKKTATSDQFGALVNRLDGIDATQQRFLKAQEEMIKYHTDHQDRWDRYTQEMIISNAEQKDTIKAQCSRMEQMQAEIDAKQSEIDTQSAQIRDKDTHIQSLERNMGYPLQSRVDKDHSFRYPPFSAQSASSAYGYFRRPS